MDISVTAFRTHCLELIRQMEAGGEPITIRRHGKAVARLSPPQGPDGQVPRPWDQLRGSGSLLAPPEESVLQADDFEALQ
jgi:antitoxin (DNA-binding transcriptional repressor) of toxin-antitoxin stability system